VATISKDREYFLKEAINLINGDRAKDYGDAYENHQRIADMWNVIISAALKKYGKVLPAHVCLMMDALKTARLCFDIEHVDSWIDKGGYTGLGGEFTEKEKHDKNL
tara:strand:+ start:1779 stop:2096 length:318 start_codon:yes stop_codon:yes gene_type:complete